MVQRTLSFLNLALSSRPFHECLFSSTRGEAFRSLAANVGVSRVAFLRHGKTASTTTGGVDFDRLLTDKGRDQVREAGSSFGSTMKPFFSEMIVSPAPRTMESAELFLNAAGVSPDSCHIKPLQDLYDGTMQPEGSQLFKKLGYAPLKEYVDNGDEKDRKLARDLLGAYATSVVDIMMDAMKTASLAPATALAEGTTLWMVGHAIYLPAAAIGVAALAGCDEAGIETILSCNTQEAEAYLISLDTAKAEYLQRPSSIG